MFPIRDENPTLRPPLVTWGLIAANLAVWVLVQGAGLTEAFPRSICEKALIPGELLGLVRPGTTFPVGPGLVCEVTAEPNWASPLLSMFMHGGWLHLLGNMWFLHIFGNNVEDSMGRGRYLVFYVLCGLLAAAAQVAAGPSSAIPMVGASGAIGGVMGAYVVLYPRVRIHMLLVLLVFVTTIDVPAYFMLGYWFLLQLLSGFTSLGRLAGGTAFWAHAGGFAAGMLLVLLFRNREYVARHRALARYM